MDAEDLIEAIKKKTGLNTISQVADYLGMTQPNLTHWQQRSAPLTPLMVANAIKGAAKASKNETHRTTIKPIVEFFPLTKKVSRGGMKFELFPAGKKDNPMLDGLREALSNSHGIYVFYDSRGQAIYAGKAKKKDLWSEMKSAFNRPRDTQSVYRVSHPERRQEFKPAYEKSRQPKPTNLRLFDLAAYFSAFEIAEGMIDNLEALIVRAFANDLLNVRMETFGTSK